ncbi:MAG TPA: hypothetical protein VHW96_22085 [Solirubrobacteraceae bacterium]|nr:hypothetical protein [Solirubrobacteraceae bacterium]
MRTVAVTRLITADDAPILAELEQANRKFLAPPASGRCAASSRRNGFVAFGYAPAYLKIGGAWQDHVLYQVLNESDDGGPVRAR